MSRSSSPGTAIIFPTRHSEATSFEKAKTTEGFVKLRLAHGQRGSILVPDALFVHQSNWYFFLPSFFGPPMLNFDIPSEDDGQQFHTALFSADIAAPKAVDGARVMVAIKSDDLCAKYEDGAQLYRCQIRHNEPLIRHSSGKCRKIGDEFWLTVFHHTTAETAKLIEKSEHFRGSEWNIQGTRKLKNVCYPYFTTIPKIQNGSDLERIAMSSNGEINLLGTGIPPAHVTLKVYRESTGNRTTPIRIRVPASIIAPPHLRLFDPHNQFEPSYYEIVQPEIVRVGLKPGQVLSFSGSKVTPVAEHLKTFEYVICRKAVSQLGLTAPYDEEETEQILHLEKLPDMDLFEFWLQHANSDQISDRAPEARILGAD